MGENSSQEINLDWSSAEVRHGKLEVALDDKPQKAWKEAFERTTRLLNRGTWDEVTLKKGRVSLGSIKPGDEDRVRHFLESVVLEANSALEPTHEAEAEGDKDTDCPEQVDDHDAPEDQEMTERLRSFGEPAGNG